MPRVRDSRATEHSPTAASRSAAANGHPATASSPGVTTSQLNIDNGTLATITCFDRYRQAVLIRTDGGEERAIDASYLANHVEHAYAITGHSSQGATVENAMVVGRPEEFTREWAYTALSRARRDTSIHLIADHGPAEQDRRGYAPPQPDREPADALDALARAMRRSEAELLAVEHRELNPLSVTTGGGQPHQPIPSPSPTRPAGWASRESTRSWRPQDRASRTSLGRRRRRPVDAQTRRPNGPARPRSHLGRRRAICRQEGSLNNGLQALVLATRSAPAALEAHPR